MRSHSAARARADDVIDQPAADAAKSVSKVLVRKHKTSFWDAGIFTNRHDGTLVRNTTHVRRMMPYIMPTRGESWVRHKQVFDLTKTLPWIENWNKEHPENPVKLFDVVVAAVSRAGTTRPGMTRFVAGGRLYDRKQNTISMAMKRERNDYAPLRMLKLDVFPEENFEDMVKRMRQGIGSERSTKKATHTERELTWFEMLPGWMVSWIAGPLVRKLDWWGLYPEAMTKKDPLFASLCISNVGSLGVDRVIHHLYEYGNIGLFCCVNKQKKKFIPFEVKPGDPEPSVPVTAGRWIDAVALEWTFDERTNDAHYCAESLQLAQAWVENPVTLAAPIDQEALQARLKRDRLDAQGAADAEAADTK